MSGVAVPTAIGVVVLVIVAVALAWSIRVRRREGQLIDPPTGGPRPAVPTAPAGPHQFAEIDDLLRSGRKLQAIKVYRESTGVDLRTARNAVEARQRALFTGTASAAPRVPGAEVMGAEIDAMLRDGRKIQAIKVYRELTGVDLRTAKDAVEDRQRALGLGTRPGRARRAVGRTWSEADWNTIDAMLRDGRKIQAIKVYRELTGVDLRTAKDAVEARQRAAR